MKLILIDGNAIVHRAYHALPPLTNREGQVVNAVYGFFTMLFRVVEDLKPTHLIVAFDTEKPTFRHAAFVGYQAQRPRIESDLSEQFPIVQEALRIAGIPFFAVPGYEADDLIGTLAKRSIKHKAKNKIEVIIVTGDRDLLQLVNENVKAYFPVKGLTEARLFDAAGVKDYLGIEPSKVIEYKALVGDQSDNYPGVPGIGPKTAISLIEKFGTLEGVYQAIFKKKKVGDISQNVINKLVEGHDSAFLSQDLARIRTDVPVTFTWEECVFVSFQENTRLIDKFKELGFRSLVSRLQGKEKVSRQKRQESQLELV